MTVIKSYAGPIINYEIILQMSTLKAEKSMIYSVYTNIVFHSLQEPIGEWRLPVVK